ncbi:hypothetical protein N510_002444 [Firmicutes bacterium ASF500]|nr:hypothetical protein N510_002444 [Firmicutes bacterium ASF500]
MRNLKRALSLALASVMLMGMMVVASSAASFPDVSAEDNTEAISVLNAVGVMLGDKDTGNFRPDGNVTRNEMAVIMSKLMLGTYEADSYVGSHPFTDVPEWASKYVAACYSAGIIAGRSETTYDGSSTVTAVEAAAMMLRALGYEDLSKGAAQWDQPVAAKANEINLFAGLNGAGNAPMNRNSVAKLSLNTLQATMVTTVRDGQDITLPDGTTIVGSRRYLLRAENYGWADKIDKEGNDYGTYIQLGEYLYKGDLEKTSGAPDSQGRPVDYKWVYDTEDVCDVLKDAKHTLKNNFSGKDLYNTLGKTVVDSIEKGDRDLNVFVDGKEQVDASKAGGNKTNFWTPLKDKSTDKYGDAYSLGNGTRTEIFVSEDAVDVCIINTFGGEVDKVYTADDVKDDEKPYVLVDGMKFETTEFQEEEVVAYTKGQKDGKDVIASMEMATPVEGEVTKVTDDKNFTIDGETYEFNRTLADKITTENVKNEVLVYVDANGYMIFKGEAAASTDYAYVVACGSEQDKYNSSKYTYYAKLLFTDGTLEEVTLKDVTGKGDKAANTAYENKIVTYTEDDGKYKLDATGVKLTQDNGLKVDQGLAAMKLAGADISANSSTVFLVCNDVDDADYDVYVGFKSVPDISAVTSKSKVAYATKNGVAKVVYVQDASVDVSSDADMIVIMGDSGSKLVKEGSDEYYEFKAVIDGEVTTVKVDRAAANDANACKPLRDNDKKPFVIQKIKENNKGFITGYTLYTTDGDIKVETVSGTRKAADDVVGFAYNGKDYTMSWSYADDAKVVYRNEDGDLRTGGISLIRTDENDTAIVVLEKSKIIGVFVQELAVGTKPENTHPVEIPSGSDANAIDKAFADNKNTDKVAVTDPKMDKDVVVPKDKTLVVSGNVSAGTIKGEGTAEVKDATVKGEVKVENEKAALDNVTVESSASVTVNDVTLSGEVTLNGKMTIKGDASIEAGATIEAGANAQIVVEEGANVDALAKIEGMKFFDGAGKEIILKKTRDTVVVNSIPADTYTYNEDLKGWKGTQTVTVPATDVKFELTTPVADNKDYTISTDASVVTVNVAEGTEKVVITAKGTEGKTITSSETFAVVNKDTITVTITEDSLGQDNSLTFTLTVKGDKDVVYTVKVVVAKAEAEEEAP